MATYISNQTGLWSSASTWLTAAAGTLTPTAAAGAAPVSFGGDKILIRGGHIVTYDVSGCFGDQTSNWGQGTGTATNNTAGISANSIVLSGGTLKASRTVNTELTAWGNINIGLSGIFDWGTTSDPLTTNANITLHYMSQLSALSASIGAAGIHLFGGTSPTVDSYRNGLYLNGKPKIKNTTLSVSAANASNVLTLASPVSTLGWEIGDRLIVATEAISGYGIAPTTIPTTVLSATYIQSFTGNQVTVSPALNTSRSAGTCVGNFSSNITIKSYNPLYPAYGIYVNGSSAYTLDIGNVKLENMCYGLAQTVYGAVGWVPYAVNGARQATAYTGNPIGLLTINVPNTLPSSLVNMSVKGVIIENSTSALIAAQGLGVCPPPAYAMYINGRYSDVITIEDIAIYMQNPYTQTAFQIGSLVSLNLKNVNVYRATYSLQFASTFPNSVNVDNGNFDNITGNINGTYGLVSNMTNCKFRFPSGSPNGTNYSIALDGIQNLQFKNCTFSSNASAGQFFQPNGNAVGIATMSNCTFLYNNTTQLTSIGKNINGAINVTGQTAQFNVYQPNNSTYDYRRFNYYHYSQTDLENRKRGITSYRIKPEKADTKFYNYFTVPATVGTSQRIKGSLKFDSNYGTAYPPSISFVGAGVSTLCACTATPDVWQDFDVTLNPTSTDDITMTITCQSSGTNGYVWLDGLPIYPFIQDVRHYGFVFDKSPDRTVNTLNTLTENQVSALETVSNLDYLYDSASYWSVTNPASSSYIDLFTVNGTILDFGSKNIVINNTGTGFSYNSSSSTITINSPNLSAGSNFNTLKTSGVITLSTGIISNIDTNANLIQTTPTSLSGIYMVNSLNTLTYNTNTPIEIEYTNCTIVGVKNDGSALVTIKKTNSTVSESDAEISTYSPTIINFTLQGGYAAIYDDTGTRQYYRNTDGSVVLGSTASGIWSYKIARYGYQLISGNFTVNPSVGGIIDISPNYIPDAFITVNNISTVSAYTDLNSYDKIHDYLSYYLTTSTGINYGELDSESFGVLNFNGNLIMSGSASSIVEYTSGTNTLKLKSSSVNDSITFVVASAFSQDGGNTIGDNLKIRSSNLDSELYFNNVNSIVFYPTLTDRDNNTNAGISLSSVAVYRFKYGSTVNGITFTDYVYSRITIDGSTLLYITPISIGSTTMDFGTVGNLQTIINNQRIINIGVQKASKLIPHTVNI